MADGLGVRLLLSVVEAKSFTTLAEYQLNDDDLLDNAYDGLVWVRTFLKSYGDWPTVRQTCENFGWEVPVEIDLPKYVADLVRKRSLRNKLSQEMRASAQLLETNNPDEAYKRMRAGLLATRPQVAGGSLYSFAERRKQRYDDYLELKTLGGYRGIPTPWKGLDSQIQGWVNGTLNVLLAMTNVGKSWAACIIANNVMLQGKRVLFVTLENPVDKIERRLDSIHFQIPFIELRDGMITDNKEEFWQKNLDTTLPADIITIDKHAITSVADILAYVYETQPDFVVVDGAYRLKATTKSKNTWESMATVIRELQYSAEMSSIPWFVTSQLGGSSSDDPKKQPKPGTPMALWAVRYAKEWAIDPDVVIGIQQRREQRVLGIMELHVMKVREGAGKATTDPIMLRWDTDNLIFEEIAVTDDVATETEVDY